MNQERFTHFPKHREGDTPPKLWEKVYSTLPNPRNETYISTPLTSGPVRNFILEQGKGLTADEIRERCIVANSGFVDAVSDHLDKKKDSRFTLPHVIGKRNSWDQLEYNQFWLHYLSGSTPEKAETFHQHIENNEVINKKLFNDDSAEKNKKMKEYQRFADAYVDFIKDDALNPVSRMIFMPGHEESFGCTIEQMLAEKLQIKQEYVVFDKKHREYEEKVARNAPWLKDHPQMKENGGQNLIFFANK